MFSNSMSRGMKGFHNYVKFRLLITFLGGSSNQKRHHLDVNLEPGTTGSVIIQVGVKDFLFISHDSNVNSLIENIGRCSTENIVIYNHIFPCKKVTQTQFRSHPCNIKEIQITKQSVVDDIIVKKIMIDCSDCFKRLRNCCFLLTLAICWLCNNNKPESSIKFPMICEKLLIIRFLLK